MQKGTLWQRLVITTQRAINSGALLPVPTTYTFVEEKGVRFFVRVLESLKRKDEARKKQESESKSGTKINPFLPPEPELTVGDVTENHIAVLNKFNVLNHHLLIITRRFEAQDTLLTLQDFEALSLCMNEYNSLGFYNSGSEAGASQQHKHLQVVPLPLAPHGPAVPIQPLLEQGTSDHAPRRIPAFPFLHAYAHFGRRTVSSEEAYALYSSLLKAVGMGQPVEGRLTKQSMPYCLLVARDWMLLVPRSREFFEGISLNSLAYAGSFFVRDAEQLDRLKKYGMMNALRSVAVKSVHAP